MAFHVSRNAQTQTSPWLFGHHLDKPLKKLKSLNQENILDELPNLVPTVELIEYLRNIILQYEKENEAFKLKLEKYMKISDDRDLVERQLIAMGDKIRALQDGLHKLQTLVYQEREKASEMQAKYEESQLKEEECHLKMQKLLKMCKNKKFRDEVVYIFKEPLNLHVSQRLLGTRPFAETETSAGDESETAVKSIEGSNLQQLQEADLSMKKVENERLRMAREKALLEEKVEATLRECSVSLLEANAKRLEDKEKISCLAKKLKEAENDLKTANCELLDYMKHSKHDQVLSYIQSYLVEWCVREVIENVSVNNSASDILQQLSGALDNAAAMRQLLEQTEISEHLSGKGLEEVMKSSKALRKKKSEVEVQTSEPDISIIEPKRPLSPEISAAEAKDQKVQHLPSKYLKEKLYLKKPSEALMHGYPSHSLHMKSVPSRLSGTDLGTPGGQTRKHLISAERSRSHPFVGMPLSRAPVKRTKSDTFSTERRKSLNHTKRDETLSKKLSSSTLHKVPHVLQPTASEQISTHFGSSEHRLDKEERLRGLIRESLEKRESGHARVPRASEKKLPGKERVSGTYSEQFQQMGTASIKSKSNILFRERHGFLSVEDMDQHPVLPTVSVTQTDVALGPIHKSATEKYKAPKSKSEGIMSIDVDYRAKVGMDSRLRQEAGSSSKTLIPPYTPKLISESAKPSSAKASASKSLPLLTTTDDLKGPASKSGSVDTCSAGKSQVLSGKIDVRRAVYPQLETSTVYTSGLKGVEDIKLLYTTAPSHSVSRRQKSDSDLLFKVTSGLVDQPTLPKQVAQAEISTMGKPSMWGAPVSVPTTEKRTTHAKFDTYVPKVVGLPGVDQVQPCSVETVSTKTKGQEVGKPEPIHSAGVPVTKASAVRRGASAPIIRVPHSVRLPITKVSAVHQGYSESVIPIVHSDAVPPTKVSAVHHGASALVIPSVHSGVVPATKASAVHRVASESVIPIVHSGVVPPTKASAVHHGASESVIPSVHSGVVPATKASAVHQVASESVIPIVHSGVVPPTKASAVHHGAIESAIPIVHSGVVPVTKVTAIRHGVSESVIPVHHSVSLPVTKASALHRRPSESVVPHQESTCQLCMDKQSTMPLSTTLISPTERFTEAVISQTQLRTSISQKAPDESHALQRLSPSSVTRMTHSAPELKKFSFDAVETVASRPGLVTRPGFVTESETEVAQKPDEKVATTVIEMPVTRPLSVSLRDIVCSIPDVRETAVSSSDHIVRRTGLFTHEESKDKKKELSKTTEPMTRVVSSIASGMPKKAPVSELFQENDLPIAKDHIEQPPITTSGTTGQISPSKYVDILHLVSHKYCDETINDLNEEIKSIVSKHKDMRHRFSRHLEAHRACYDSYLKLQQELDLERSHRDAYIEPFKKQNEKLIDRLKTLHGRLQRLERYRKLEVEGFRTDITNLTQKMRKLEKELMKSVLFAESGERDIEFLRVVHANTKRSMHVTNEVKRLKAKLYQIESEIKRL